MDDGRGGRVRGRAGTRRRAAGALPRRPASHRGPGARRPAASCTTAISARPRRTSPLHRRDGAGRRITSKRSAGDPEKTEALHRELTKLRHGGGASRGEPTSTASLLLKMMDEDPTLRSPVPPVRRAAPRGRASPPRARRRARPAARPSSRAHRPRRPRSRGRRARRAGRRRGTSRRASPGSSGTSDRPSRPAPTRPSSRRLQPSRPKSSCAAGVRSSARDANAHARRRAAADRHRAERPDLARRARDRSPLHGLALRTRPLATAERIDEQAAKVASVDSASSAAASTTCSARPAWAGSTPCSARRRSSRSRSGTWRRAGSRPSCSASCRSRAMVGDDEEFWPYEGEYWADEYEGYR